MMTIYHFLNYCTIVFIIFICCQLTYFISKSVSFSVFKAFLKLFLHWLGFAWSRARKYGDVSFIRWYGNNPVFLCAIGLRFALIGLVLYQITMFTSNSIFQKPPFVFTISPIVWAMVFGLFAIGLPMISKFVNKAK